MKIRKIYNKLSKKGKTLQETFYNKEILVTGGCGSIGSEIVQQLLKYKPYRIKVFDNNESGLFYLQQKLKSPILRILIGDIRDKERLRIAIKGTDIIFHAAALKHVPLCEFNPFEAVNTNVIGTQNLVTVAREENVEKVIAISTDKAVNPINTMGATKLLSEKLVMTARIGDCKTKFSCVRFGNVLNSVGSVIPIFKTQIKSGGPVTITSSGMVRFFMSMSEAVNLVLKTAQLTKGEDIFILKMNQIRVLDLAEVMIKKFAPKYGYLAQNIKIKEIGVRPGEKLNEHLYTTEEKEHLLDLGKLHVLKKSTLKNSKKRIGNLQESKLLSKTEIDSILDVYNLCD